MVISRVFWIAVRLDGYFRFSMAMMACLFLSVSVPGLLSLGSDDNAPTALNSFGSGEERVDGKGKRQVGVGYKTGEYQVE